jgi:hypothetical protein
MMAMALLRMSMPRSWTMPGGVQSMTSSLQGQVYLQNQVRTLRIYFFPSDLSPPNYITEANPFAKKPNGTTADGSRNPFGRDNPNNKSLHKSESFFDKAEAAETGKWKGLSVCQRLSFLTRAINKY